MIDYNEIGNEPPKHLYRPYLWLGDDQDEHVVYFRSHLPPTPSLDGVTANGAWLDGYIEFIDRVPVRSNRFVGFTKAELKGKRQDIIQALSRSYFASKEVYVAEYNRRLAMVTPLLPSGDYIAKIQH